MNSIAEIADSNLSKIEEQRALQREVYVGKKESYDHRSEQLTAGIQKHLGITGVRARVFNKYYIQGNAQNGLSDAEFEQSLGQAFAELPVDNVYDKNDFYGTIAPSGTEVLDIEYVPGLFDQRANAAQNSLFAMTGRESFLSGTVKYNEVIVLEGPGADRVAKQIAQWHINPVESRIMDEDADHFPEPKASPENIETMTGFIGLDDDGLREMIAKEKLAMDLEDMQFAQSYFRDKERRDPTRAELKIIETYWSDHCRHTTFNTQIHGIEITGDPKVAADLKKSLDRHQAKLKELKKDDTLMNLAQSAFRILKDDPDFENIKNFKALPEDNACCYETEVELEDGTTEKYLVMFKNETHNSPTEKEPFGGAATCIGGCVRDPLSGRGAFIFGAMRISGAGNPTEPLSETRKGKLSQLFISQISAMGFASYGNQLGVPTGKVQEYYHEGYKAKHFDMGAVMAAVKARNVRFEEPKEGDMVLMIGGRTGPDGIGGATVSSQASGGNVDARKVAQHVQKGNAPEERKLLRLFQNPKFLQYVKKCNDFGAGGVAVAIGELTRGLDVDLDKVPLKTPGLADWEIALSESQERMAIVISSDDLEQVMKLIDDENLEGTHVATVTNGEDPQEDRLQMRYRGLESVNISREFLDSGGPVKKQDKVSIKAAGVHLLTGMPAELQEFANDARVCFERNLGRLGVANQKGLGGGFDSSIGRGTLLAPYGGKTQRTPQSAMAALIPTGDANESLTASISSHGGLPQLSDESPYHAGMYAIIEAVSKQVAHGADYKKVWLSLQEYFGKLDNESERWGEVYSIMLGAFRAMIELKVAAIGGKDSASGTDEDDQGNTIHVPTTLFAVGSSTLHKERVVSSEFKNPDNQVVCFEMPMDESGLPDWSQYIQMLETIGKLHNAGVIKSSCTVEQGGVAATVARMTFGNNIGITMENFDPELDYATRLGSIVCEINGVLDPSIAQLTFVRVLGSTTVEQEIAYQSTKRSGQESFCISIEDAYVAWSETLEGVYSLEDGGDEVDPIDVPSVATKTRQKIDALTQPPKVVIPVFEGTNSEEDTKIALIKAGFREEDITIHVFNTQTSTSYEESCERFVQLLEESHMLVLPGGFSGADEPDGSGKLANMTFRSPRIRPALQRFVDRKNTYTIGVCNGNQQLVKLGLIEHGTITDHQSESDMTITHNTTARHLTDVVYARVTSVMSQAVDEGNALEDIVAIPASHSEGRYVFPGGQEQFDRLVANGQIILQMADADGNPHNRLNGSYNGVLGVTSPNGRVIGLMPHPERIRTGLMTNIPRENHFNVFEGAARMFGIGA